MLAVFLVRGAVARTYALQLLVVGAGDMRALLVAFRAMLAD